MGIRSLIGLALAGSAGITLLILACTIDKQNWWPAIVTIFYLISPFPILLSRKVSNDFPGPSNGPREWAYFFTTGIFISAIATPITVLPISTAAIILSIASSLLLMATIVVFFAIFYKEENYIGGFY